MDILNKLNKINECIEKTDADTPVNKLLKPQQQKN